MWHISGCVEAIEGVGAFAFCMSLLHGVDVVAGWSVHDLDVLWMDQFALAGC
jgi:hypothetical protein